MSETLNVSPEVGENSHGYLEPGATPPFEYDMMLCYDFARWPMRNHRNA